MRHLLSLLRGLSRADSGVAAVEFCLTLPILLLMTVGAYDVSRLISARLDYQQALTEAAGLAIAQPQGGSPGDLRKAAAVAAGVPEAKVTVVWEFRCNNVVIVGAVCPNAADERARYASITVNGSYTPMWRHFTIKGEVPIRITRTVRVQ